MKLPLATTIVAASVLACGYALAQVGAPLGSSVASGVGSSTPVGPVGIPLGAMELAAPGISPPPTNALGCPTPGSPGLPAATSLFDGGGMGTPNGCAPAGGDATATGQSDALSTPPSLRPGRAGIPLGSTEIGSPGLSPLPPLTTLAIPTPSTSAMPGASSSVPLAGPPAALEPPCPLVGTFTSQSTVQAARSSAATGTATSPGC
jgi:hypothetical protein